MGTSITGTYKMKRTMIFRIKMSDKMSDQMISDQLLNNPNRSLGQSFIHIIKSKVKSDKPLTEETSLNLFWFQRIGRR